MSARGNRKFVASTPLASTSTFGSRLDLNATRLFDLSRGKSNQDKLDGAYNEYLQAMIKKRIVTSAIRNYENLLQQQIDYQQSQILGMKKNCENKKTDLENIKQRNEFLKIFRSLEEKFIEFESICGSCCNVEKMTSFSNLISAASKDLQLVGVKKLVDIEEWFELQKLMNECCKFLKSFFESNRSLKEFELIDEVSGSMRNVLDLQITIQERIAKSSCVKKEICTKYLQEMSDLFALLGKTKGVS